MQACFLFAFHFCIQILSIMQNNLIIYLDGLHKNSFYLQLITSNLQQTGVNVLALVNRF